MSLYKNATAAWVQPFKTDRDKGPTHPSMPLATALRYADKISDWIAPHCRQIEPVGEIRRRCATCAAVELLVVPRFEANPNLLFNFLDDYVQNDHRCAAHWRHSSGRNDLIGLRPGHHDDSAALYLPKCWLVIHTTRPETWF